MILCFRLLYGDLVLIADRHDRRSIHLATALEYEKHPVFGCDSDIAQHPILPAGAPPPDSAPRKPIFKRLFSLSCFSSAHR